VIRSYYLTIFGANNSSKRKSFLNLNGLPNREQPMQVHPSNDRPFFVRPFGDHHTGTASATASSDGALLVADVETTRVLVSSPNTMETPQPARDPLVKTFTLNTHTLSLTLSSRLIVSFLLDI
jgi:hypothetical protein